MNATTTKPLSAACRLYREMGSNEKYEAVRWIANVLLTCSKPAKRLAALKKLIDNGREITAAQFIMPYEALVVDGAVVVAMPLLDRGEEIPYSPNDWFRH